MTTLVSQFRVDDSDFDKAKSQLKKYEAKHQARYFIVREIATQSGKVHLQGWVQHTASDNTYRLGWSRYYKELGTHEKCFTPVKSFDVYVSYIVNNDGKPRITSVDSSDVLTNYTQAELDEFNKFQPFIDTRKNSNKKSSQKDWYDIAFEYLEDKCVKDGKIDYLGLKVHFRKKLPRKVNYSVMYDNLVGMGLRLEEKYPHPDNTRFEDEYFARMSDLGKKIFY